MALDAQDRKNILSGKGGQKRPQKGGNVKGNSGKTQAPAIGPDGKPLPPPMTFGQSVMSWVKTIVTSLLIVMVVNGLLIASFVVPTGSMENEVMAGDFVFVNKFIYGGSTPQTIPFFDIPLPYLRLPGLREPRKGDVIVFIYPGGRNEVKALEFQYYLKRCVATAGDTLEVRGGKVFINHVEQPLPRNVKYINQPMQADERMRTFPEGLNFTRDEWGPMRIPKIGDVIPLNDSTYYAYHIFIQREGHQIAKDGQIITLDGAPAASYRVQRDYCFGMGDNRNNSLDSRYWGFVPVEDVVGTPLIVYWSWDPTIPLSDFFHKLGSIRWGRIFTGVN